MSFGASHKARQIAQAADPEMTLPFSASNYASCQVLEGERADARDDVFSLACIAYLLLSGAHPFPKRTAIEAREARLRLRRPANLSGRQWQALRSALRWERENRPADVQRWLSELDLGGAAKKLAPINDLLEPPAAKEPRSWLPLRASRPESRRCSSRPIGWSATGTCCRASTRPRRSAPPQVQRRPSASRLSPRRLSPRLRSRRRASPRPTRRRPLIASSRRQSPRYRTPGSQSRRRLLTRHR